MFTYLVLNSFAYAIFTEYSILSIKFIITTAGIKCCVVAVKVSPCFVESVVIIFLYLKLFFGDKGCIQCQRLEVSLLDITAQLLYEILRHSPRDV